MAPLSEKLLREIQEMQMLTGRMLRNMSCSRMVKIESGPWQPPVDIYESAEEITVYCDLAGVTKDSLERDLAGDEGLTGASGGRAAIGYQRPAPAAKAAGDCPYPAT